MQVRKGDALWRIGSSRASPAEAEVRFFQKWVMVCKNCLKFSVHWIIHRPLKVLLQVPLTSFEANEETQWQGYYQWRDQSHAVHLDHAKKPWRKAEKTPEKPALASLCEGAHTFLCSCHMPPSAVQMEQCRGRSGLEQFSFYSFALPWQYWPVTVDR